ncbi:MAG: tagaturonate epimerase family protein [Sedimentisphaerales bacterium]|nr:tagaturonate epimerase family protein [Sedimentisphaerales bacterium]
MKFDKLNINPARNPAVLDTMTWDADTATQILKKIPYDYFGQLWTAVQNQKPLPVCPGLQPYSGSLSRKEKSVFLLAELSDGQRIFIEFLGHDQKPTLGIPLVSLPFSEKVVVAAYKTDAAIINSFFRNVNSGKGSRALGTTPRLGIGVRMTTSCWPAILHAMEQKGFCANIIQNSVRELNFLSNLREGRPADKNYACGFGTIETGYTGSTFEGLWVSGVLDALKYPATIAYGADADHLQVKRGAEGLKRAKQYLDSCRYYSFYTLDMADILGFAALQEPSDAAASALAENKLGGQKSRQEILSYHKKPCIINGSTYTVSEQMIDRLIGKYWDSLEVLGTLNSYLKHIKNGESYDIEFTVDEHPPEVAAFDCLTSEEEYLFVLREIQRRSLPVTHVAPNFGIEKGFDYRCPDGLAGLEKRISRLYHIAEAFNVMVDFHSADDLTSPVRKVIKKATGGRHHYKISPMLQIIFAGVVQDFYPELFREWWDDAVGYARREAAAGAAFAQQCLDALEASGDKTPSYKQMVFHHFSFAFVGKRDANGQFLHRERFYGLSQDFYAEYQKKLCTYLCGLAEELF